MDIQLLKGIVLFERLPVSHAARSQVYGELKRSLSGAAGERRTFELLDRELDLGGRFSIVHNVNLPYMNGYTQIDILILHEQMISVLEVKNMVGEFYFDSDNFQFHRLVDGRLEGMRNPESQLHRAVKAAEKFFGCKVHGTIVLTSRAGKVAVAPKLYPVIALDFLPFHLEKLIDPKMSLNIADLEGVLRRSRGQYKGPDLLEKHKIDLGSLVVGVRCLGCGRYKMEWSRLRWRCVICGAVSADAHEFALQEYAVLFGNEFSTGSAYSWLGIKDKYVLYRMLEKPTIKINNRGKRLIIDKTDLLIDYFKTIYS